MAATMEGRLTVRMPVNPTTGKAYRGGNVLNLIIAGMQRG